MSADTIGSGPLPGGKADGERGIPPPRRGGIIAKPNPGRWTRVPLPRTPESADRRTPWRGAWHLSTPEALHDELKKLIVETLALEEVTPSAIETDAPLFVEGLGLDSIDALELAMVLEERYGVTLGEDPDQNRETFYSVRTLAAFILESRSE